MNARRASICRQICLRSRWYCSCLSRYPTVWHVIFVLIFTVWFFNRNEVRFVVQIPFSCVQPRPYAIWNSSLNCVFNCFFLQADGTDLCNFVHGHETWDDYLTYVEQDGAWGDHLILCAAANCFETCIHVVSSLHNDVVIRPHSPVDESKPLVLGHIHEVHYVSLQPIQGKKRKSKNHALFNLKRYRSIIHINYYP